MGNQPVPSLWRVYITATVCVFFAGAYAALGADPPPLVFLLAYYATPVSVVLWPPTRRALPGRDDRAGLGYVGVYLLAGDDSVVRDQDPRTRRWAATYGVLASARSCAAGHVRARHCSAGAPMRSI